MHPRDPPAATPPPAAPPRAPCEPAGPRESELAVDPTATRRQVTGGCHPQLRSFPHLPPPATTRTTWLWAPKRSGRARPREGSAATVLVAPVRSAHRPRQESARRRRRWPDVGVGVLARRSPG